jgi:hypothetical protein
VEFNHFLHELFKKIKFFLFKESVMKNRVDPSRKNRKSEGKSQNVSQVALEQKDELIYSQAKKVSPHLDF